MRVDVLVGKVGVELGVDRRGQLVGLGREDDGEGLAADLGVAPGRGLGALLGQALGPDELGLGVQLRPLAEEDVVLNVGRDNVLDGAAQLGELGLDVVGEGDGREDGQGARGEFDW